MPVYFIRSGESDRVKIGTSDNVAGRLAQLQLLVPEKLHLIREIDGGRREEAALHRHYRDRRLHGEWYLFHESMLTIDPPAALMKPARIPRPCEGVAEIIETLGAAIAAGTGISNLTLAVWKHRGRIPAEHWLAIVSLPEAVERGVTLHLLATLAAQHKRGAALIRSEAA
jgi:hypothetical protein